MSKNQKNTTHRIALVIVSVMLVVALLAVVIPQQQAGAVGLAVTCSTNYTVVSGDTLSSIALKYNITVQELATANDLKEPYQIFVGQKLCIPGSTTATTTATVTEDEGPTFTIKNTTQPYTIEIATVQYPKNSPFFVRVNQTDHPSIKTKLGTMKTNKNGVAKRVFRLTKNFRDVPLTICLKNNYTDEVQCKLYTP